MDKGAKDKVAGSSGENGEGKDAQNYLHSRTGEDETKGKTQERKERRSRKRSLSAGSEKMERVGDRKEWMGIVQQSVAPAEEEEFTQNFITYSGTESSL
jgi:hypothetical protein